MSIQTLKSTFASAKKNERHDKVSETRFWCDQYRMLTEWAIKLLEKKSIEAAEKQEPVAWMYPDDLERFETSETFAQAYSIEMVSPTQGETVPLYTTPQPQREWVGLTDEEIALVCGECAASAYRHDDISYARAIEAKLKERNHD